MLSKLSLVIIVALGSLSAMADIGISTGTDPHTCPNMVAAQSDFNAALAEIKESEAQTSDEKTILANEEKMVSDILSEISKGLEVRNCENVVVPADPVVDFKNDAVPNCPHRSLALNIAEGGRHRLDVASEDYAGHRLQADKDSTDLIQRIQTDIWTDQSCRAK